VCYGTDRLDHTFQTTRARFDCRSCGTGLRRLPLGNTRGNGYRRAYGNGYHHSQPDRDVFPVGATSTDRRGHPPRSYPDRPFELTAETVRSFLESYESVYLYSTQLREHPEMLGRTN